MVIKDDEPVMVARSVKPDSRNRISLPKKLMKEGITYHVFVNNHGQIILDPQVTIPASEAWLFSNSDALASIRQGLSDAKVGKVTKVEPGDL